MSETDCSVEVAKLWFQTIVLGEGPLQVGASYVITNYSTTTSAGADVGNIQNVFIPAYLQTNSSQYIPSVGDSFPGNIGTRDNTLVNSLNRTANVMSGISLPGGFYSNIPIQVPIQTRPDP